MSKLAVIRLVAAVALLSAAISAILAAGFASPAAASPAGWSSGTLIDPIAEELTSVSCPTASFCIAVDYSGNAFTYNGNSWSSHSIGTGDKLLSVSCPTASFCAAVDFSGDAFTYNGSSWSSQSIDAGNILESVSCPTASFCAAVDYDGNVFTYNGSSWSSPDRIDAGYNLYSVSCPSASFCAAGDNNGNVLTYNSGSWSSPRSIDAGGGGLLSVSCPSASSCAAVDGKGNVLTYNGSSWSSPDSIDASGGGLNSVSCPTASFCTAMDSNGNVLTYSSLLAISTTTITSVTANPVVSQPVSIGVNATWPNTYSGSSWSSKSIDAGNILQSVSCPTASFCAAVDMSGNALTYSNSLTPSGQVTVSDGARSCEATLSGSNGTATGTCSITEQAASNYSITASYPGDANFVSSVTSAPTSLTVGKATSTTALGLSATKVTYGKEGAAQLSVTVSPQYSGSTPTGTVTVKQSTTTLCTFTLPGAGSCTLSATELPAGTYGLVATYGGSTNFGASTSAQESLTVAKATSKTTLRLSAANVTYGHEQAEHLSVTVSPQYSGLRPAGTVRVKQSTTTLCVITLKSAKGSCKLSAKRLKAGTYRLVATYRGSPDFKSSTSAKKKLTVVK
jgi:hypothetical protein